MLGDERLQLADHVDVPTEREIRVDPLDQRGQVKLLEPADLVARECVVGEVGERRSAPERKRFAQQLRRAPRVAGSLGPSPFFKALPEAVEVELTRLDTERV